MHEIIGFAIFIVCFIVFAIIFERIKKLLRKSNTMPFEGPFSTYNVEESIKESMIAELVNDAEIKQKKGAKYFSILMLISTLVSIVITYILLQKNIIESIAEAFIIAMVLSLFLLIIDLIIWIVITLKFSNQENLHKAIYKNHEKIILCKAGILYQYIIFVYRRNSDGSLTNDNKKTSERFTKFVALEDIQQVVYQDTLGLVSIFSDNAYSRRPLVLTPDYYINQRRIKSKDAVIQFNLYFENQDEILSFLKNEVTFISK